MNGKKITLALGGITFLASIMQAQQSINYNKSGITTVTTAVPFLLITPDARTGGMGEAGAASTPDANSMYWNPSKFAFSDKKYGFSMSYTPWLRQLVPDISLMSLAGYGKVGKMGAVAGSLRYFTLGTVNFTDNSGNAIGTFKPSEFAFDVGYSLKLGPRFSVGLAARYINSNLTGSMPLTNGIYTHAGRALGVDIACYYHGKKHDIGDKKGEFSFGVDISNIGTKIAYTDNADPSSKNFIPTQLRIGFGYKITMDEYNTITFLTDATKLMVPTPPQWALDAQGNRIPDGNGSYVIANGKDPYRSTISGMFGSFTDAPGGATEELQLIRVGSGMEYWYNKLLAVRMGYYYENKNQGNRQYFTVGIGVRYSVFGIDVSYLAPTTQRNPLQNTLRFTLLFDFDAFKKQNTPTDASSGTTTN
ncbi:MAG: type IX secretion system outer membrane channel protein PorV [Bacteroidetes bacterium]|nr:type IX secretion system outer membrane channel protein PorV [Bacteroidota bacterium]